MEYDHEYENYLIQELLKNVPEGMLPSDYLEEILGPCEEEDE